MKIQVGGLAEGLYTYRFEAQPADLELGEPFGGTVAAEIRLDKTGRRLLLTGTVSTVGSFVCDRCVAPFERTVSGTYRMYYVQDGQESAGLDPAEVQVIPEGQNVIDIREDVRQTMLLTLPLKVLCREDCRGLCPMCGTNLNEQQCECKDTVADPRWDKLRSLPRN
jgi:uncharacterized protein